MDLVAGYRLRRTATDLEQGFVTRPSSTPPAHPLLEDFVLDTACSAFRRAGPLRAAWKSPVR